MRSALRRAWSSRAPRERTVIAVLAAILAAGSYLFVVDAAHRGRTQLQTSIAALRTQAALLDQQAAEHQRLRAVPPPAASAADLRTLIQAARLPITRIDAPDADHVQVTLGAVAFADWLGWIAALEAQHVRLETARIEALAAPGLVSVAATFARSRAQ
jgi:general secretion pathway protein M